MTNEEFLKDVCPNHTEKSKWNRSELLHILEKHKEAINYSQCCTQLKDEGQATLSEYATELINMQENPQDSNKDWKIVVIQNTIGKLYETLQTL